MVDHHSGFTWGETFEDKVSDNMVMWVMSILMSGYGKPEIVLTDNGGEVTNTLTASK